MSNWKFLEEKYPHRFQNSYLAADVGWADIIIRMVAELESTGIDYKFYTIKEKFGTLRVYVDPAHDLATFSDDEYNLLGRIISKYERESSTTCEMCGDPGTLRNSGWMKVSCDHCHELRLARFNKKT